MRKGSITVFELHVEKVVLGLAALFMVYVVATYLFTTPNTIEYNNEEFQPGELSGEVLAEAREMQNRAERVEPDTREVPPLRETVRAEMRESFLSDSADDPVLEPTLAIAAPIHAMPPIAGSSGRGEVRLVRPLAPDAPVVTAGRSVVEPRRVVIAAGDNAQAGGGAAAADTEDVGWVTISAYWPRSLQKQAHEQAGYASYRTIPYVAGVDVQRQRLLPSGEWSDWEDVSADQAMPRFNVPTPRFDDVTGRLANKEALDQAFQALKQNELELLQPSFFPVVRGDQWYVPELPGRTIEDFRTQQEKEMAAAEEAEEEAGEAEEQPPTMTNPYAGGAYGGGSPFGGRDRSRGANPYGAGGNPYGGGRDGNPFGNRDRGETGETREQAEQDLAAAVDAILAGAPAQAKTLLESVMENRRASARLERQAESLMERVEDMQLKQRYAAPRWQLNQREVVATEDRQKVAVWYHDDTAAPGETYRYRLRVNLWNRYLNQPQDLANPQMSREAVLRGEWSPPSAPIEPVPDVRFFVNGAVDDGNAVRLTVARWHEGWWYDQTFQVAIGEPIGGVETVELLNGQRESLDFATDAIVMDIRDNENVPQRVVQRNGAVQFVERPATIVYYLDTRDGELKQKMGQGRAPDLNFAFAQR